MIIVTVLGAIFLIGVLSLLSDDGLLQGVGHLYWPCQTSAVLDKLEAYGWSLSRDTLECDLEYGHTDELFQ